MAEILTKLLQTRLQTIRKRLHAAFYSPDLKTIHPYRAFTQQYDRVVDANRLNAVVGSLSPAGAIQHQQRYAVYSDRLGAWRQQVALETSESESVISRAITQAERADTVIAILVDQSGSLNEPDLFTPLAAACAIAEDFLVALGIRTEVLGFTTSSWFGGASKLLWQKDGQPRSPGRLCDLLHIVYRSFDDKSNSDTGSRYRPMLRPGLLKENIDGEAVEWASGRLMAVAANRKLLVVISDGAPVDDTTLSHNDPGILHRHIQGVVQRVRGTDIEVVGVGMGHDTSLYYSNSVTIKPPEELPIRIIEVLKDALMRSRQSIISQ